LGVGLFLDQSALLARQKSFGEIVDNFKNKTPDVLLLGILKPIFQKAKIVPLFQIWDQPLTVKE
jgi:hypothetical protein